MYSVQKWLSGDSHRVIFYYVYHSKNEFLSSSVLRRREVQISIKMTMVILDFFAIVGGLGGQLSLF